ncbi:PREDICTED: uncharacterized protein LOC109337448 [Lupinus angustifolius]|uniref:uncharacterized protein LOC109337448 n=1 Tax=Lupinus angustifolius TaxID=3871 RepID=UPI00092E47D8|nr:PREDICTED: uncharacterized protein LOC109337448 [Lupinus angustifolius]
MELLDFIDDVSSKIYNVAMVKFAVKDIGNLSDGKKVCVEEGVAMFLVIICHNMRHRVVAERFQHSLQTKCIGAIDGTHVSTWAPAAKQTVFHGRKVLITQNVLAVCNFDMLFTFVYSGWEGTTNDSRVFLDALTPANDFPKPIGGKKNSVNITNIFFISYKLFNMYSIYFANQFYLVDSGFPNMSRYLAPFRKTGYHLRDFRDGGRPRGKQELFNHRHSSLRNVIERCFGVLKARFPILKMMPNYPVRRQRLIPNACCTIHNFIRLQHSEDRLFGQYSREDLIVDDQGLNVNQQGINVDAQQATKMVEVRDTIAT